MYSYNKKNWVQTLVLLCTSKQLVDIKKNYVLMFLKLVIISNRFKREIKDKTHWSAKKVLHCILKCKFCFIF